MKPTGARERGEPVGTELLHNYLRKKYGDHD